MKCFYLSVKKTIKIMLLQLPIEALNMFYKYGEMYPLVYVLQPTKDLKLWRKAPHAVSQPSIDKYGYNQPQLTLALSIDEQPKTTTIIRPSGSTSTTTATTSTTTMRQSTINELPRRIQEFDRFDQDRIQSPASISSGVINIKQEIKPETSMGVDNLVASYVDSTTFLHSPSNIQHSPMDIQNSVLVSGQSSVSLTSEELSPDDLTSSSGHARLLDPLSLSTLGMVNPNAVSNRRHHGSSHSGSSEELPCKLA
jgi:hypothetical protein